MGSPPVRLPALVALTGLLIMPGHVAAAVQADRLPPQRIGEFPLHCRGGDRLAFDTVAAPSDTGESVRLSLRFAPNPTAAGPDGQTLESGACAWADRPLNPDEPRRLRVTIHRSDSTPRQTVRDTAMYWSFIASDSDSGHITAVGYRHWHASSRPLPRAPYAPGLKPGEASRLAFDPRHLPLYALVWALIAWAPVLSLVSRWSGWRRLAGRYPGRDSGQGMSFRSGVMVMGKTSYRGGARLTADATHLHFAMPALSRPGHPPFSVPWSDIRASVDEWPWFPFKGTPAVRLTIAGHPALRILVQMSAGERIAAAMRDHDQQR